MNTSASGQYKFILTAVLVFICLMVGLQAHEKMSSLQQAKLLSDEVNIDLLMNDVFWLADDARLGRASGTPSEDEVAAWLIKRYEDLKLEQFKKLGLSNFTHNFEFHVYDDMGVEHPAFGENIIGIIPGKEEPNKYLIVSAHYDHLGIEDGMIHNGADDDATGVAAVLEIARVIKDMGLQPNKTIIFAAFSAEEIGRYGSRNFCHMIYDKQITKNMMGLNFEMFGIARNLNNVGPMYMHIWEQQTVATQPIIQAVKTASDALNVDMITSFDIDPGSDALELLDCGVSATTMDVGGGERFEFYHPYYHSPEDKPEHIDQRSFHKAVQVASMSVWLLANE